MPACCGAPLVQRAKFRAPARAASELWLAVAFHAASGITGRGSDASSSSTVHACFRLAVAARTLATSAGVTHDAELPNALRT